MQTFQDLCAQHTLNVKPMPDNTLRVVLGDVSFTVMRTAMYTEPAYILQGFICTLPEQQQERDALCSRLCALQLARLKHEMDAVPLTAITLQGEHCMLQCRLERGGLQQDIFGELLTHYCNLLATWKALSKGETYAKAQVSTRGSTHVGVHKPGASQGKQNVAAHKPTYGSATKFFSPDMLG